MNQKELCEVLSHYFGKLVQYYSQKEERVPKYGYISEIPYIGTEFGIHPEEASLRVKEYCFAQDIKVVLKPLSELTDEDAINVADICGIKIYSALPPGYVCTGKQTVETVKKQIPRKVKISDFGAELYFYLQSKGYDLPQYLLGGKTMYEAGLAIYNK